MTKQMCNTSGIAGLCACLCVTALCATAPAFAEPEKKSPVLVELFTSQNCGACPAANENLIKLSETADIFPLTFSVAYWDYLGWKDTFAKPEFAQRQKAYADVFEMRGPYTPQTVVDGCIETSGRVSIEKVEAKIKHAQSPHGFEVDMTLRADGMDLSTVEAIPTVDVWLVEYLPGITAVAPGKGPNRKRLLSHVNMVTGLHHVGEWDGAGPVQYAFECAEEACAVIVQEQASKDVVAFGTLPDSDAVPAG